MWYDSYIMPQLVHALCCFLYWVYRKRFFLEGWKLNYWKQINEPVLIADT